MRRMTSLMLVLTLTVAFQTTLLDGAPMAEVRQEFGTIAGTAESAPKQPLANHTVRLRDINTGQTSTVPTTTTNALGEFTFNGVNPGSYIIEVVDPDGIIIGTSSLVVNLVPGAMTATGVTVTATLQLIATAAAVSAAAGAAAAAAPATAAIIAAGLIHCGTILGVIVVGAVVIGATVAVGANNDASPIQ